MLKEVLDFLALIFFTGACCFIFPILAMIGG